MKTAILVLLLALSAHAQDPVATALRGSITLNGQWQTNAATAPSPIPVSGWTAARVPAEPITDGTTALWYQDSVYLPMTWLGGGRRWLLDFDQVGHYAAVYLNGQQVGTNYGQFAPFEIEITSALVTGTNVIDVYVHNSDATYAYQGANLNQSACVPAGLPANCQALAYRDAANDPVSRNWVGIAGDVSLVWRPEAYVASVATIPSVRASTLGAVVNVAGNGSYDLQMAVLDGSTTVLSFPSQTVQGGATVTVPAVSFPSPWLWGPPGYGTPKLYTLQSTLLDSIGNTVDVRSDSFGFREVWIQGQQLMLNGVQLHMVGNYGSKLSNLRITNDRRPLAALFNIYQASGLNLFIEHWDQNPVAYGLADEMGMLTEGSFFCNGPLPQAQADSQAAWQTFMQAQTAAWTTHNANHPSIVVWRPFDVMPGKVSKAQVEPVLAGVVSAADPQQRPIADGGTMPQSIDYWSQNLGSNNTCASLTPLEDALAAEDRPLFVKEIYGGFAMTCAPSFVASVYGFMSAYPAMAGLVTQEVGLYIQGPFTPQWPSQSGIGNRPSTQVGVPMPNWNAGWMPSAWSTEFASLYGQSITLSPPQSGDSEATVPSGTVLTVASPASGNGTVGAMVDGGSVWLVTPWTGATTLTYYDGGGNVLSQSTVTVSAPGVF